jgi:hypothetical protein
VPNAGMEQYELFREKSEKSAAGNCWFLDGAH